MSEYIVVVPEGAFTLIYAKNLTEGGLHTQVGGSRARRGERRCHRRLRTLSTFKVTFSNLRVILVLYSVYMIVPLL